MTLSTEREDRETWKAKTDLAAEQAKLLDNVVGWPTPVREVINGTEEVVRFGIYDRSELSPSLWSHGRIVLIGDAAHPARHVSSVYM